MMHAHGARVGSVNSTVHHISHTLSLCIEFCGEAEG
jgi:hypothetical protein